MKAPGLYIIHGWTYTVEPWTKTLKYLEKQGLKAEILHVPGLTASSRKVWTIEEYAHWADRHIPDGAVALGHSNGGRILLNLCAEKPEKLSHLILLDSAGVYENSGKRDVSRSLSKRFGFLKKIPGLAKIWHKITGASDYDRAPANMKQTLANMLESDKKLNLGKITTPTSILWGEEDTITPPRHAETMHAKIKDSRLEIHAGWTHAPYISHPGELAKAIFRAVKTPPEPKPEVEVTEASSVSASLALKKAAGPIIPNTAKVSASLAFKKAGGAEPKKSTAIETKKTETKKPAASSNKTVTPETNPSIIAELAEVDFEKTEEQL